MTVAEIHNLQDDHSGAKSQLWQNRLPAGIWGRAIFLTLGAAFANGGWTARERRRFCRLGS
ncbi:MAG: hypothetical protein WBB64_08900 [Anaerolineales bacterium]